MAIYHCSIKIISRGKGKSAVAAAAYRSGETLTSEYDGITHDYTRKRGIVHAEILLPSHAPREYADRSALWNAVEKIEKAKNSQLAREIEIALPKELSREQNISLVRDYVKHQFVNSGMCADVCIHDKGDGNPHAHIMLTMRPILASGAWGDKQRKEYILNKQGEKIYDPKKKQYKCKSVPTTDWNEQTKAEQWRAAWAQSVNAVLEKQSIAERVDHRSFERHGIELIPTIHLGVSATQMERKGIESDRGDINREIVRHNNILRAIFAKLKELKARIKDALSRPSPENVQDVLQVILDAAEQRGSYGEVRNVEMVREALAFVRERGIETLPELRGRVNGVRSRDELLEFQRIRMTVEVCVREFGRNRNHGQRKIREREER
jgi:ATP-dependent exoDNAse (exonuclease V) alpha subunit